MATATVQPLNGVTATDVVTVDQKHKADWDRYIQEAAGVIAWHGYDWAHLLKQHHGAEFYPLAVYDGARICGILPLYRLRLFRKEALISVPYFVAGGIAAADRNVQQALLSKAIQVADQLHIRAITFKQYKLKLDRALLTDDNYYNRELSLEPDVDRVWNSITENNRAKIEEARQLASEWDYPCSDVSSFYRLLLHDQHAAGVPCVSKKWVEDLYRTGMYEIALLRNNGELVAGTMVKKFRDTVSFPFSCLQDHSERTELFAYALYWKLISVLAQQGIRIMHSGRIPKTDAAFGYRLGWGGTKYNYYYQYHGLGEGKTEFSNKRGRKRALIEAVWKRMPVSLAAIVGPTVVKQFP